MRLRLALVAVAAAVIGVTATGGVAAAAPSVALGGGSGIVLPDADPSDRDVVGLCTLTAVGYDNSGSLVALTAGHCGVPGDRVIAEYQHGAGVIGRFTYSSPVSDIAVIDLDDAKVAPLRTVGGVTINGIGAAPALGTIVCKEGRTTGNTCGITWGYDAVYGEIIEHACSMGGDSGGPLVVGDRLVGLVSNGYTPGCFDPGPPPFHAPINAADINVGIADINAHGGGFRLF
ncbi:peptidase S1 (plasmid) [Rhodococcus sp. H-CA8f]|uniref:S1 family peptidase n=2 Tax=Rhodococcus erythropolis group TaxID=2840174 RepID=A0AAW6LT00_RHOSG|nr:MULTISPECIES: S1 family peptidase [Rhodococcus]ATI36475.1 peptidase S1 [Rhodococcus sp. H-CA8f]MDE8648988.1 S1 family peptidase [Rhodococcus qingshengii]